MKKIGLICTFLFFVFIIPGFSYVGPGAGFAFMGSFFFIFFAFILAFFYLLTFPIRTLIRAIKRVKNIKNAKTGRVVIIGFDGMDFKLYNRFLKEGKKFPHFQKLNREGTFSPLLSTEPPISPVAWSTFSTGVNPGKHNIFDFLTTDRNTYMPKISGSDILPPKRMLKIGKLNIPLSKPKIELKRKSQSFWKIASSKGIYSAVLRVPYTFPPEKFNGLMLAGLGTPDLRGTQGSFSFYSEKFEGESDIWDSVNEVLEPDSNNGSFHGKIKGPSSPFSSVNHPLEVPFVLTVKSDTSTAVFQLHGKKWTLNEGELSPWIPIYFKAGAIKISGIIQVSLEKTNPLSLYVSPIQIDPEKPSMPISHPKIFSVYLAKKLDTFATLGMAEDTTAVNEKVLSESTFLQQVYGVQEERERSFFDTLKRIKKGLVIQVFETTDRIQHMFWRYLPEANSPAEKKSQDNQVQEAIYHSYKKMDDFLGKLFPHLRKNDVLLIVSDHGFGAFNRGFHLNSWLAKEGYLVLKNGKKESGKWFADVDWSKSRAYGQGLNGLYLNIRGREKQGIVSSGGESEKLIDEIKGKLEKLVDSKTGQKVLGAVYKREQIYRGPYTPNAPDIVLGYRYGHRVSWESSVNFVGTELFSDNTRYWSGDHAFTRDQIPGVLFSNKKIKETKPTLMDIAPTVLSTLGIQPPPHMDGKSMEIE